MKKTLLVSTAIWAIICCYATTGYSLSYDLSYAISGDTPSGTPPFVTLNFVDSGADEVTLTINTDGLYINGDNELDSVAGVYFNINENVTGLGASIFYYDAVINGINIGSNAYKADGDGYFDILIDFAPPGADRLTANENVVIKFTSTDVDFSANSFAESSVSIPSSAIGTGIFHAAAHIQNTNGPQGSGWIADGNPVPEPTTMLLFGTGLIGLAGIARRKNF